MSIVYQRSKGLTKMEQHYCPGCTHGIAHKLIAEVMEEMGIIGSTIGVAPVGCSLFAYNYFSCDMEAAAHGRAPALAVVAIFENLAQDEHGVVVALLPMLGELAGLRQQRRDARNGVGAEQREL